MVDRTLSSFGARSGQNAVNAFRSAFRTLGAGDQLIIDGSYTIDDQVIPTCHITGNGTGRIEVNATARRSGFLYRNNFQGQTIRHLTINSTIGRGISQEAPIYVTNGDGMVIWGNTITGITFGHAISIKAQTASDRIINNKVLFNRCVCTIEERVEGRVHGDITAIELRGFLGLTPGYADTRAQWRATKTAPVSTVPCTGNVLIGNDVTGGYYGISFTGVSDSILEQNKTTGNMRGFSLQNGSNNNRLWLNQITENISAGFHNAYGSSGNTFRRCSVVSSRSLGEGLLQAYVNSPNNSFHDCYLESSNSTGAKFFVYYGVDSGGGEASGITMRGTCSKAYVGIESDWDSTRLEYWHRARNNGGAEDNYANGGMHGVRVRDSYILGTSNVPHYGLTSLHGKPLTGVEIPIGDGRLEVIGSVGFVRK